jgi:hypothetical protein
MNYESSKARRLNALFPNLGRLYDMRVDAELSKMAKYEQEMIELSDLAQAEFNEIKRENVVSDFYNFFDDSRDEFDDVNSVVRDYFDEVDFDGSPEDAPNFPVHDSFNKYFNKIKDNTDQLNKDLEAHLKKLGYDSNGNLYKKYDFEAFFKNKRRKKDF